MTLLRILQALSGVLWLLPIWQLAPSLWRVWRGKGGIADYARAPLLVVPFTAVLSAIHWVFIGGALTARAHGGQLVFWTTIWALWCLGAFGMAYSLRSTRNMGR